MAADSWLLLYTQACKGSKVSKKDFAESKEHIRARNNVAAMRRTVLILLNAIAFGQVSDRLTPELRAWMKYGKMPLALSADDRGKAISMSGLAGVLAGLVKNKR